LTCKRCNQNFSSQQSIGLHFSRNSVCNDYWQASIKKVEPLKRDRTRLTVNQRCSILLELIRLEKSNIPMPQKALHLRHPTISEKNISMWSKLRQQLFEAQAQGYGSYRSLALASRVRYLEQEKKVYMEFVWRRRVLGLKATEAWIAWAMEKILAIDQPNEWQDFRYSNGWLDKFKDRWKISSLCVTNKKSRPIALKEPLLKSFHKWFLRDLQLSLGPPYRCPIYGRFSAASMFAMDQIPLPFVLDNKRTMSEQGQPVFLRVPKGSGLDKRQASIQVCLRAEGEQVVRVALIFRGTGQRIQPQELHFYRQLRHMLVVYFQPKAWADGQIMMKWAEQFEADTAGCVNGEKVLILDRHGAQMLPEFKAMMAMNDTVLAYTPPDCTDCVSPVDKNFSGNIKKIIGDFYHADMEENYESWCDPLGGLSAWEIRVRLAVWTAAAWAVLRKDAAFLRSTFTETGCLIAMNGSENKLIKIKGLPNYDFMQ